MNGSPTVLLPWYSFSFSLMSEISLFQVDRLMELHFKYLDAMQVADKKIEGEKHVRIPACLLPTIDLHSIWVPLYLLCPHGTGKGTGTTSPHVPPNLLLGQSR